MRLGLLGQAALLAGPVHLLEADADLASAAIPHSGPLRARTLSGQLDAGPTGVSRWPRLDRYGKALMRVCVEATGRPVRSAAAGLYVSSLHSCLETNAAFDQGLIRGGPRLVSPLLFPYTLPGAAASEVAAHLGLTGPYLVFSGGAATALASFVAAMDALDAREAKSIVVASADVLGPATVEWLLEHEAWPVGDQPPLAEAAVALWLGTDEGATMFNCEAILAGAGEPGGELVRRTIDRARLDPHEVGLVLSATVDARARALEAQEIAHILPDARFRELAPEHGDTRASLGLIAVKAALDEHGPTLVMANDDGGSVRLTVEPTR